MKFPPFVDLSREAVQAVELLKLPALTQLQRHTAGVTRTTASREQHGQREDHLPLQGLQIRQALVDRERQGQSRRAGRRCAFTPPPAPAPRARHLGRTCAISPRPNCRSPSRETDMFRNPPSTDDDENTEEAKYLSILKTFDMTTVRESGRRGARPSRNFRPKIYIAIQKMTCPLTVAEADRVPHPSPYHRYRRSTVPRSV